MCADSNAAAPVTSTRSTLAARRSRGGVCSSFACLLQAFVRQGLVLAAAGVALGLAAAAGLTQLMSSLLFRVTALDPLTYAAVSALLLVVSVLASYLPARRAMSIDPVHALRGE